MIKIRNWMEYYIRTELSLVYIYVWYAIHKAIRGYYDWWKKREAIMLLV